MPGPAYRKKLIEVGLPLGAINAGCVEDKERKTRHIRNLHKWFAPMPLPAWRTMLFAAIVDDPAEHAPPEQAAAERRRLLALVERLAAFRALDDPALLAEAKSELLRATAGKMPLVVDPFCGGGSTLLEAQRLGLPVRGNDLNPVPVTICRALVEHPGMVKRCLGAAGRDGIRPGSERGGGTWRAGFSADVRHYAERVRERALAAVGALYPAGPEGRTVSAFRWARAVPSPSPAFAERFTPIISNFWLSRRKGHAAWIEVSATGARAPAFAIRTSGEPPRGTKVGRHAVCLYSGAPITREHLRRAGNAGQIEQQLMAVVTSGEGGPRYFAPTLADVERISHLPEPGWAPDLEMPENARWFSPPAYGLKTFSEVFTRRQLLALEAFAEAVREVAGTIRVDALAALGSRVAEAEAHTYADAVSTLLLLAFGKLVQSNNALVRWYIDARNGSSQPLPIFDRQAIPMVWDYVEVNPFGGSVGDWRQGVETALSALTLLPEEPGPGRVTRGDAGEALASLEAGPVLIATDPPYFDNIGYADLSDFFYVWLRRAGRGAGGDQFATILSPKAGEMIADPYRHGGDREQAEAFFRARFFEVFRRAREKAGADYPVLIVYAFKQEEDGSATNTGWEAMLEGLLRAGLGVVGTWPLRTSRTARMIGIGTNALASAIVVVCRPRALLGQAAISRAEFVRELRGSLPAAVALLKEGNLAPVDMAQAALGPGMQIFSAHARVVEADGAAMTVKTALQLINQALGELLANVTAELDPASHFAVTWYEAHAWDAGAFGEAETLAKARNVSVAGVAEAGILHAAAGAVRLRQRAELSGAWRPGAEGSIAVWEATQHLIKRLDEQGEEAAARLLKQLGALATPARDLAYWLHGVALRRGSTEDARAYNALGAAWPDLEALAARRRGD